MLILQRMGEAECCRVLSSVVECIEGRLGLELKPVKWRTYLI